MEFVIYANILFANISAEETRMYLTSYNALVELPWEFAEIEIEIADYGFPFPLVTFCDVNECLVVRLS